MFVVLVGWGPVRAHCLAAIQNMAQVQGACTAGINSNDNGNYFSISLSLVGQRGCLTQVRRSSHKSSTRAIPILTSGCSIFMRPNSGMGASVWVF